MSRRADDAVARVLPHNLDAEKSVLGALLIDNAGYDSIASWLQSAHFYRKAHRDTYAAIVTLLTASRPADLRTVAEELTRLKLFEDVGGAAYLGSLVDGVPRSTNVRYYAETVREKAALRKLIKIGTTLIDRAFEAGDSPQSLITQADTAMTELATDAQWNSGAVPLSDDLGALMADFDHKVQHRGQVLGLPSGFPSVDLITHGWQKRQMVVIAGQTSFGKSVLALNLAHAIAKSGQRVVYYSYEMTRQELQYRLWSSLAEIPLTRILWGNLSEGEYAKLAHAMEDMALLPLEINDGASRSISAARAECRQIKADRGLAAVVFDHFQLMDGAEGENRTQQLGGVSRAIQTLGVELDVTTFTLSQMTLAGDEANREPQLGMVRECKQLEHDANIAAYLHPYKPSEARTEVSVVPMKFLIRKHRGGRLGCVPLHLERDYVRFVEGESPAPSPKEPKAPTPKKSPLRW